MGCVDCKYKGMPDKDMTKRCANTERNQIDDVTLAIVGGYPVTCDKYEKALLEKEDK